MKTKSIKISVISLMILAALVVGIFAGCSSKNNTDKSNTDANKGATGGITVISREEGSGTRDAFTELMDIRDANDKDATVQSAEITNSTSVMMSTVQGNKNAIGYVSLGSLSDTVKAVKLNGVEASTETIKDGTYTLQRPFIIAYRDGKLSDVAKDFVSYILSKQGESVINKEGYIGVSPKDDYKASGKKGTVTLAGSTSVAPVMNVLADEYKKLNPDVKIEIQESGSSAGIESAIQGAVDIAMSSRELKDDEKKVLAPTKIALDGIAVIVNNENAVDNLTPEQIKDIFLGNTTQWADIK